MLPLPLLLVVANKQASNQTNQTPPLLSECILHMVWPVRVRLKGRTRIHLSAQTRARHTDSRNVVLLVVVLPSPPRGSNSPRSRLSQAMPCSQSGVTDARVCMQAARQAGRQAARERAGKVRAPSWLHERRKVVSLFLAFTRACDQIASQSIFWWKKRCVFLL